MPAIRGSATFRANVTVIEQDPDAQECAVIGLPDQHYVEHVHVVVMKPGGRLDEPSLRAHCAQRLAGYKCPPLLHHG